jgi:hypothetical protein
MDDEFFKILWKMLSFFLRWGWEYFLSSLDNNEVGKNQKN